MSLPRVHACSLLLFLPPNAPKQAPNIENAAEALYGRLTNHSRTAARRIEDIHTNNSQGTGMQTCRFYFFSPLRVARLSRNIRARGPESLRIELATSRCVQSC